jgi:hypothetical protein
MAITGLCQDLAPAYRDLLPVRRQSRDLVGRELRKCLVFALPVEICQYVSLSW